MATTDGRAGAGAVTAEQVDAIMLGVQALVGVAARSVAEVEDRVTLPQLRVLMLIASHGTMNLNALAQAMDIHPSNASRYCDRLMVGGLIRRTESSIDRRNLVLELTDDGRHLVEELIEHRRKAVRTVLEHVPESRRRGLVSAMRTFGQVAGEVDAGEAWRLGWHG
jgi:DNA-binding MarR family transcriptional regulator